MMVHSYSCQRRHPEKSDSQNYQEDLNEKKILYLDRIKKDEEIGTGNRKSSPGGTNLLTCGNFLEDALENAREVLTGILDHGDDIPDPVKPSKKEEGLY